MFGCLVQVLAVTFLFVQVYAVFMALVRYDLLPTNVQMLFMTM